MGDPKEAWEKVGERFGGLGRRLREHLDRIPEREPRQGRAVEDALHTLGESIGRAVEALGDAVRDPDVHSEAKEAARSLADALNATFEEVGEQVRARLGGRRLPPDDEPPPLHRVGPEED